MPAQYEADTASLAIVERLIAVVSRHLTVNPSDWGSAIGACAGPRATQASPGRPNGTAGLGSTPIVRWRRRLAPQPGQQLRSIEDSPLLQLLVTDRVVMGSPARVHITAHGKRLLAAYQRV